MLGDHRVEAPIHVRVEFVIGGPDLDPVPLDDVADLEERITHLDVEGLGLLAPRDRATVVVRQHDHRHAP